MPRRHEGMLRTVPRWERPFRALQWLGEDRTWIPGGGLYAAAVVLGGAVALIGVAAAGWPWWTVLAGTMGGPLLLWSTSMVSAFTGWSARLSGVDVPARLRAAFRGNPPEATRKGMARLLRASPIQLYGPERWSGDREVHVVEADVDGGLTVDLHHGSTLAPPWLAVECRYSSRGQEAEFVLAKRAQERSLWFDGVQGEANHLTDGRYFVWLEEKERAFAEARRPAWDSVAIPIDGIPVPFDLLPTGGGWVALARLGVMVLAVRGEGIALEDVRLIRLRDLSDYFDAGDRSV